MRSVNNEIISRMMEHVSDEDMHRVDKQSHRVYLSPNVFKILEKMERVRSTDSATAGENLTLLKYDGVYYIVTKSCENSSVVFSAEKEIALDTEDIKNCKGYYRAEDSDGRELNQGDIFIAINLLLFLKGFLRLELESIEIIANYFDFNQAKQYMPCEILPFLTRCRIYELGNDSEAIFQEDLDRWEVQLCILDRKEQLQLAENEDYLQEAFNFLTIDSTRSVIGIVRDAVLMENPKSVYLQFFRVLEYLFILRRGIVVSGRYTKLDRDELIKHYSQDGFWEREDESVKQLITTFASKTSKTQYIRYLCSIGYINADEMEASEYVLFLKEKGKNRDAEDILLQKEETKLVEYIWQSRNMIAHYRYGQNEIKGEQSLKQSIKCLINLLMSIYQNLDCEISDIHKNTNAWHEVEWSMN